MTILRNWRWNIGVLLVQLLTGGVCCLLTHSMGFGMGAAIAFSTVAVFAAAGRSTDIAQMEGMFIGFSALTALIGVFVLYMDARHPSQHGAFDTDVMLALMFGVALAFAALSAISAEKDSAPWRSWLLNFIANLPLGIGFVLGGFILLGQQSSKPD